MAFEEISRDVKKAISEVFEKQSNSSKLEWNTFIKKLGENTDNEIIKYAKSSGTIYVGGRCTITSKIEEDEFSKQTFLVAEAKIYFKDQFTTDKKSLEQKIITQTINFSSFSKDDHTLEKLRDIIKAPYEFDIAKPTINKNQE